MKQEVAEAPKSRRGLNRVFWWGVGFWMLAWTGAVCGIVAFDVNIKGCPGLTMGAGRGSLFCNISDHRASSTALGLSAHEWIWQEGARQQISNTGGFASAYAIGHWMKGNNVTYVAFPLAGFLWLWLSAAWAISVIRKRPYKVLTLALIVLGGVTAYGVVQGHRGRDTAACVLNVRNIQQAVRSACGMGGVPYGGPIPWERVFGPGGFMRPESRCCPTGPEYQFESLQPGSGKAAAHCQNPDHQRAFLKKDITDW